MNKEEKPRSSPMTRIALLAIASLFAACNPGWDTPPRTCRTVCHYDQTCRCQICETVCQ